MQVAVDVDITDVIDAVVIPMRPPPVQAAQLSLVPTKKSEGVDELPEGRKGFVD